MKTDPDRLWETMLAVLACGYGTRAEVVRVTAERLGLRYPSGGVSRQYQRFESVGMIVTQNVRLFGCGMVQLVELTPHGQAVCGYLAQIPPQGSEWQTMRKGHQGDDQMRHTAAVLTFAAQARRRGYFVTVLPDVPLCEDCRPDLLVECMLDKVYVEVEMRARRERVEQGKFERGLRMARRMGAELGIVGMAPYARDRFADWVDGALVTDLSSLCKGQNDLWWQEYQAKGGGCE